MILLGIVSKNMDLGALGRPLGPPKGLIQLLITDIQCLTSEKINVVTDSDFTKFSFYSQKKTMGPLLGPEGPPTSKGSSLINKTG